MPGRLSDSTLRGLTARYPRWHIVDDALEAEFAFNSYMAEIDFVQRVAQVAEEMNHHPDIFIGENKVRLLVCDHKEHAITLDDVRFIERVEPFLPA